MQECLRVEKLPSVFLGKRESLFIMAYGRFDKELVGVWQMGDSQKSSVRR